jgi:PAS domain S-box-containing protein
MTETEGPRPSKELLAEQARRLITEIPVVVYTCGVEEPFPTTYITENVRELYGYEPRDVLADGEFWVNQMLPDEADIVRQGLSQLESEPASLEYRFRRADGTHCWLRDTVKIVFGPDGAPEEIIGCIIDITERKRVEKTLEETQAELEDRVSDLQAIEARLRSVTNNAPAWILSVDAEGTIEFINRTHGYLSQEEVVGSSVYTWQPPEHHVKVRAALDRVFSTGKPDRYETVALGEREGDAAWYESNVAPVVIDDKIVSAIIIASDVTEQKRAQQYTERIRDLQTELEHATRLSTIGEMTASIAHELNQPLAAITQFCGACLELLASSVDSAAAEERLRTYLQRVSEQGLRAGEIVRSLRTYTVKRDPRPTEIDVNEAIREILPILELDSDDRRCRGIKLDLDDAKPRVRADRIQLQQVMINLIRNAKEACAEGGATAPCVQVATSIEPDDHVRISVLDAGPGLPEDDPDQVFEPFFSTKDGGMGLGLAISQSIVEANGGTLRARNKVGGGAEFWFSLGLV